MIDLVCPCGRIHRDIRLLPLRCRCGHVTRVAGNLPAAPPPRPSRASRRSERVAPPQAACVHLGGVAGIAQCDCRTAPSIYACDRHGLAMIRRVEHAPAGVAMRDETRRTQFVQPVWCEECPDRNPP